MTAECNRIGPQATDGFGVTRQLTVLEEFDKLKSGDVVLPARHADGTERTIRLRCVTTPDEPQKVLLSRLGLTLPRRLRRIDEIPKM